MTEQAARSDDGLPYSDPRCRRLAECALAAAAASERSGFFALTGVPLENRRRLLQAIVELAAGKFQIVEIARAIGGHLVGPSEAGAGHLAASAAAAPPLFVIDDAEQQALDGLRALCQIAPLSADWASMLSVRAVLITRFAPHELDFLAPRLVASIPYDAAAPDRGEIAEVGRAAPLWSANRDRANRSAESGLAAIQQAATGGSAAVEASPLRRSPPPTSSPAAAGVGEDRRRDLRPYALAAYLLTIGALAGWYLAVQASSRPGGLPMVPSAVQLQGASPPPSGGQPASQ